MKMYLIVPLLLLLPLFHIPLQKENKIRIHNNKDAVIEKPYLIVLGTVQDAGSPQAGCKKKCCRELFIHPDQNRKVVSLGIIDPENKKKFIFEATPDFTSQLNNLSGHTPFNEKEIPDGIFLTHAHIGHYTGLMYLGREAMNTDKVPVYAMPRMKQYLETNGPWSQLVNLKNIILQPLSNNQQIALTSNIKVTPFIVPHRDEYSETVGYIIEGPAVKVLFIPDIDKWEKWPTGIIKAIAGVDYAFIDGTFYDANEIDNRNMADIPHPFIIESMDLFKNLPAKEKNKIYFIHFNHTNPVLSSSSEQTKKVNDKGFHIARMNEIIKL